MWTSQARGLNAEFRSVALRFDEAKRCFELDVEALAEALGPQTAALIVNTPQGWPRMAQRQNRTWKNRTSIRFQTPDVA